MSRDKISHCTYSTFNGSLAGTDNLNRSLHMEVPRKERKVGLFYFLWLDSYMNEGIRDNTKILAKDPESPWSRPAWEAAGGCGDVGSIHWWGEPLFGYYSNKDEWVVKRHIQMFIQADIDYLVIDVTNGPIYTQEAMVLFENLDAYYQQGFKVPQVSFYTHTRTEETIDKVYREIYLAHPEYKHLWFCYEGKPMIIGDLEIAELPKEITDFFNVKQSYMNSYKVSYLNEQGVRIYDYNMLPEMFPWIDFSPWPTELKNPKGEVWSMTISVAEIVGAISSDSYLCKTSARSRNFDGITNRHWHEGEEDAWKHGYNFQRQIEYALEKDPPMVFITGWNEWIAGNWESDMWMKDYRDSYLPKNYSGVTFVDNFDINNSRDIEPMKDGYGDNYFMQMVDFIRRYKGTGSRVEVGPYTTVDLAGDWSQWDDVTAVYRDTIQDVGTRDLTIYRAYEKINPQDYRHEGSLNDIQTMKVTRDAEYFYFYAACTEDIVLNEDCQMTLFIRSGKNVANGWNGYDYVVHRNKSSNCSQCGLECYQADTWVQVAEVDMHVEGAQLMLRIPAKDLGYVDTAFVDIQFKWADGWTSEQGIWTFYTEGESAPYGRLNYVFSNQ